METLKVNGVPVEGRAHAATFVTDPISAAGKRIWAIEIVHDGTGSPVGDVTIQGGMTEDGMQDITSPVAMVLDPATETVLFFAEVDTGFALLTATWTRGSGTMNVVSAKYRTY